MIELRDVWKGFDRPVLQGVDLFVPEGSTCVLLGRSGSGKSVLIKLVIGLLKPDRGVIKVDGQDLAQLDEKGMLAMHEKLGVLFQAGALFDSISVFDNVAFPLREKAHLKAAEVNQRVRHALELVELSDAADRLPAELSGGMRKRVAFARAIVLQPKILLYDDPTAGLDPLTTEHITDEMLAAKKKLGITTLAITNDLPSAFRVADTVALLHEGKIVVHAPSLEFQASKHPAVEAFLLQWHQRKAWARGGASAASARTDRA